MHREGLELRVSTMTLKVTHTKPISIINPYTPALSFPFSLLIYPPTIPLPPLNTQFPLRFSSSSGNTNIFPISRRPYTTSRLPSSRLSSSRLFSSRLSSSRLSSSRRSHFPKSYGYNLYPSLIVLNPLIILLFLLSICYFV